MGRKRKKKKLWSKQSKYKRKDGSMVAMDSTWETVMAMRLDELNVEWKRDENMKLEYRSKTGRKRNYIPDFYLPDYDVYIEVKGYWTDAAKYKMKDVQKRNTVKILILESLEEIAAIDIDKLKLLM
jgi:predicted nuclease of restriction endonuclease-like RecB superfamily